jgi:DNA-directed RNA polymerase sigma subunit (sigma70/sigma32)
LQRTSADSARRAAPVAGTAQALRPPDRDGRLLTAAEERELAQRKDEGDEEAKRKLIEATSGS